MLHCKKCGGELPEEAKFCMRCGAPVQLRRMRFLVVASVLAIISSCFALASMPGYMYNYISYGPFHDEPIFNWLAVTSVFGFSFGLTGGILALLRQHFALTTIGVAILLFSHVLSTILPIYEYPDYFLYAGVVFGTPLIIASALSLIFTIANRKEFT